MADDEDDDWIEMPDYADKSPVDGEQMVQVRWRDMPGETTHRAGVFNWDMVQSYRLVLNKAHSR